MRRPGGITISPGSTSDHISAFWDFLPTACELAGVEPPADVDGPGTWADAVRSLPAETRRVPFVVGPEALLDDPVLYEAVVAYLVATRNHLRNQERLLADVRTARQRIEAASGLARPHP